MLFSLVKVLHGRNAQCLVLQLKNSLLECEHNDKLALVGTSNGNSVIVVPRVLKSEADINAAIDTMLTIDNLHRKIFDFEDHMETPENDFTNRHLNSIMLSTISSIN